MGEQALLRLQAQKCQRARRGEVFARADARALLLRRDRIRDATYRRTGGCTTSGVQTSRFIAKCELASHTFRCDITDILLKGGFS